MNPIEQKEIETKVNDLFNAEDPQELICEEANKKLIYSLCHNILCNQLKIRSLIHMNAQRYDLSQDHLTDTLWIYIVTHVKKLKEVKATSGNVMPFLMQKSVSLAIDEIRHLAGCKQKSATNYNIDMSQTDNRVRKFTDIDELTEADQNKLITGTLSQEDLLINHLYVESILRHLCRNYSLFDVVLIYKRFMNNEKAIHIARELLGGYEAFMNDSIRALHYTYPNLAFHNEIRDVPSYVSQKNVYVTRDCIARRCKKILASLRTEIPTHHAA
jgi:hypothetical protein